MAGIHTIEGYTYYYKGTRIHCRDNVTIDELGPVDYRGYYYYYYYYLLPATTTAYL
jgi:hypothetical protein